MFHKFQIRLINELKRYNQFSTMAKINIIPNIFFQLKYEILPQSGLSLSYIYLLLHPFFLNIYGQRLDHSNVLSQNINCYL